MKIAQTIIRWLFKKLWSEPAAIKGPVWTAAFLTATLTSIYFVTLVYEIYPEVVAPVVLFVVCLFVMRNHSKPKRLGKDLPYKRR